MIIFAKIIVIFVTESKIFSIFAPRNLFTPSTMNYSTILFQPSKHPFFDGVASLGNIRGGLSVKYRRYLMGNTASDMRRDWQMVGNEMRKP
jgi:hypothetical protein